MTSFIGNFRSPYRAHPPRRRACRRTGCFETLESREYLASDLVITEFMASNDATLHDRDGSSSDWIEVFNCSDAPVNLSGWSLTDDATDLRKWRFPAAELGAGGYLVVFASAKDRAVDIDDLHTNFKLSASGEYLALVSRSGEVVSEFNPGGADYPEQLLDVSYGMAADSTRLLLNDRSMVYRVPTAADAAVGSEWTAVGFDDSAWTPADEHGITGGIGFSVPDLIGTDVSTVMFGVNASLWVRQEFQVDDPAAFASVALRMQYNDGFVAYINGVKVAEANAPNPIGWNSEATRRHAADPNTFDEFAIGGHQSVLIAGTNVLAVHALNRTATHSDMVVRAELAGVKPLAIDTALVGYLEIPTPGEPNRRLRGATVTFDQPSGTFRAPFLLRLSADMPAATIHYTLGGGFPTEVSPVYDAGVPLMISATTRVRAIAVAPSVSTGAPSDAWYVVVDSTLDNFTSDLPIVVLDNFGGGWPGEDEFQFNSLAIYEPDAATGRSSVTGTPDLETAAGVKRRGSSTGKREKASFAVEAWDEHDDDRQIAPLGMPADSDWVLYAAYNFDRALLRNTLAYELSNQVGRYAPRTRFVELFQNSDGGDLSSNDYRGIYVLMEKIKCGPDRVDLVELEPQHDAEPEITGGWLLKIDRLDPGDRGFHAAEQLILYADPKEEDVTAVQGAWIQSHLDAMYASLADPDPETGYAQYIDVDSWIDHHILNVLPQNPDAFALSVFFFLDRGGKVEMGPIWDFDRTIESADDNRDDNPSSWDTASHFDRAWWQPLFQDPWFQQRWWDRWFELRQDVLSEANIMSIIDTMAADIAEAQERNFDRWPDARPRSASYPTLVYQSGKLDGTWQGEVEHMKVWLRERLAWIDSQSVSPPTLQPNAGRLPIGQEIVVSADAATIYYTTDGSDPRGRNGEIHTSAIAYNGVENRIVLTEPMTLNVRARVGEQWSALASAQFLVAGAPDDASGLVITELNYNPHDPTAAEVAASGARDNDDFEFIELANVGDHTIDLTGIAFTEGIDFAFSDGDLAALEPGEFALVVGDPAAFRARYGAGLPVAGAFADGRLSNDGERLVLVDRVGAVLHDFAYPTRLDPAGRADGVGSSLEVVNVAGDSSRAANWRVSGEYGGSPGVAGAGSVTDVIINEVLSRSGAGATDAIELCNTTNHAIDISGWYLGNDPQAVTRYRVPDNTVIGGGQYIALDSTATGLTLNGTRGGQLWLLEASPDGRPERFVDHVTMTGSDVGVSLGRWPDADPAGILSPMTELTLAAANSGPSASPVVLSEVHYHPAPIAGFTADFDDGHAGVLDPVLGNWTVADGRYRVTPALAGDDTAAIMSATGALTSAVRISATVNIPDETEFTKNAVVLFDYKSPTDFKFASIHVNTGLRRIGQRDADGWHFLAQVDSPILADSDVTVTVVLSGTVASLGIGGLETVHYDFGVPLHTGRLGIGTKGGEALFDNIQVESLRDARSVEFVELSNTSNSPVDLSGWRLAGAMDFAFTGGTVLAAGESLVVVPFDPRDDRMAADFRTITAVGATVPMVGPYPTALDDTHGMVRLTRPLVDGGSAVVGHTLVDAVQYTATTPWPVAAAGGGASLQRIARDTFGNFSTSWRAAAPTPGFVLFVQTGDMNFDGGVDSGDVEGFVLALASAAGYEMAYGAPAHLAGDLDRDGDVDFDDIDDLVALILAGSVATPTPAATTAPAAAPTPAAAAHDLASDTAGNQRDGLTNVRVTDDDLRTARRRSRETSWSERGGHPQTMRGS